MNEDDTAVCGMREVSMVVCLCVRTLDVCMRVCVSVCACLYVCACVDACMYLCVCVCVWMRVCMCQRVRVRVDYCFLVSLDSRLQGITVAVCIFLAGASSCWFNMAPYRLL